MASGGRRSPSLLGRSRIVRRKIAFLGIARFGKPHGNGGLNGIDRNRRHDLVLLRMTFETEVNVARRWV
jgi:hypothetical protein